MKQHNKKLAFDVCARFPMCILNLLYLFYLVQTSGKQIYSLYAVLTTFEVWCAALPKVPLIHPSFTILRVYIKKVKYLHPPKVSPSGLQTLKSKAKGKVKPFPRCVLRCNFLRSCCTCSRTDVKLRCAFPSSELPES